MRRFILSFSLLMACTEHGADSTETVVEIPATVVQEEDQLEAACRAAGPAATGVVVGRLGHADRHADAIADRIVAGCLDRADVGEALCIAEATSLPGIRRCAPEWALPWLGIETCDAYFHDIICVLDHVVPEAKDVEDTLYQAMDAWYEANVPALPGPAVADACEVALDAIVQLPQAESCFHGRSLGHAVVTHVAPDGT